MALLVNVCHSVVMLVLLSISSQFCPTNSFQSGFYIQKSLNFPYDFSRPRSGNDIKRRNLDVSASSRTIITYSTKNEDTVVSADDIFGAEFALSPKGPEQEKTYWRGNQQYTEITPEKRGKVMKGYNNLRITFLLDNLFISALGLCLLWSFGTYKDAFSYGVGALLGTGYAALLARYVESLGSKSGGGAGGGAARFAPVVLLILLYSKNKDYISIVPEILGFFTFQVSSLLQIFNEDAYGESELESEQ